MWRVWRVGPTDNSSVIWIYQVFISSSDSQIFVNNRAIMVKTLSGIQHLVRSCSGFSNHHFSALLWVPTRGFIGCDLPVTTVHPSPKPPESSASHLRQLLIAGSVIQPAWCAPMLHPSNRGIACLFSPWICFPSLSLPLLMQPRTNTWASFVERLPLPSQACLVQPGKSTWASPAASSCIALCSPGNS